MEEAAVPNQQGTTPDENKDELQEKTDEQESDLSKTDEIKDSNKNENDRGNKRLRDRYTTFSKIRTIIVCYLLFQYLQYLIKYVF